MLLARQGDLETAERLAAEAVALTVGWDQDDSTAEVLADQAHVLRLVGKESEAQRQARRALVLYEGKGNLVGARRVLAFLRGAAPL